MVKSSINNSPPPNRANGALPSQPRGGWTLPWANFALVLALSLASLDQTMPGIALPQIINDLHTSNHIEWVLSAYLVAQVTLIPIIGILSSQLGRKRCFIVGLVIFVAGSYMAGAAPTMGQLIFYRGLQGVGSGSLMASVFVQFRVLSANAARMRWLMLFIALFGLCSALGPAIGEWIMSTASWRWMFYLNLPLGMVALVLLLLAVPTDRLMVKGHVSPERFVLTYRRQTAHT